MTTTDSRPPQSVTLRLEFLKPFAATNTAQFDFAPSGSGTNVTWAMSGHNNDLRQSRGAGRRKPDVQGRPGPTNAEAFEDTDARFGSRHPLLPSGDGLKGGAERRG